MATRLINAIGKGLGKTVKGAARSAASRATRDIPDTKSFYNLGMGVGPFIRNTVQSYQQNSSSNASDTKKATASLGFAKENVVAQKNIAGQLSALTSIMSDIRKISLAQLNLQRASMPKGTKGFGDRSGYLSLEQKLEGGDSGGGRASLSGTPSTPQKGGDKLFGGLLGFMGNNPLMSAGLLGALYLGFKKDIDVFLEDSGLSKLFTDLYKKVKDEVVANVKAGISSVAESIKQQFDIGLKKLKNDPASAITPSATLGGAIAANRLINKVPIIRSIPGVRAAATVAGGVAGYLGGGDLEQLYRDANMEAKTPEEKERKEAAKAQLTKLGVAVGGGVAGTIALKKGAEKLLSSVTPTATPGAAGTPSSAPPSAKVPDGKPLTSYGSVGENREMAKNKTVLEKSKANFAKTLQLLRKLIAKMGMPRIAAYIAARFAAAAALGATGFLGGPVGFITTALTIGLTIYDLYSILEDLDKEVEEKPATSDSDSGPTYDANGSVTGPGNLPGATPTQPPAASSPPNAPPAGGGDFGNPLPSATGSKGRFGEQRGDHLHGGVDLSAPLGAPILSVGEGEVIATGDQGDKTGLGKFVIIKHPNGMTSTYGHMSSIDVKQGDKLKKGQSIGKVGSTGKSDGPHLHIEMKNQAGDFVNPRDYIKGLPAYSGTDSGANPEGSLKTIPGKGSKMDSAQNNSAPGSPSGADTPGSKFASVFGFDPSRLGVDMSKELSGSELAQLNSMYGQITGVQNVVGDAMKEINKTQQSRSPQQHSDPAPVQTAGNTQAKEKDFLWHHHNPAPQLYYAA